MSAENLNIFFATGCTLLGMAGLYLSWKRKYWKKKKLPVILPVVGWLMLIFASYFWCLAFGTEFGIIYGLTIPSLFAGIFLIMNMRVRDRKAAPVTPATETNVGDRKTIKRNLLKALLALPYALVCSLLTSTGIGLILPLGNLGQMMFSVMALPLLWGLFAYWLLADTNLKRPILFLFVASFFSSLRLALG